MNDRNVDEIDYFRDESLLEDPYPYYEELRAQCPVHQEVHHGVAMVTGYDEAMAIYANPKAFSSCNTISGPFPGFPVPLEGDDVSELIDRHSHELPGGYEVMTMDGSKHTAHRGLMMRNFTPRRISEIEGFIHTLAHRLIDDFVDQGACEFTSAFALPFTMLNICELLGVPESDHEMFKAELLGPHRDRGLGSTRGEQRDNPFGFLHQRFTAYIEDRRANPQGDVLTKVATARFPDGTMPEVIDVVRLASALFVAGSGTTAHMFASAFRLLGEHPDIQKQLRDQPELTGNFVEELLRVEPPVKGPFRLSRVPTTIGGVDLSAGTTVMIVNSAVNRDSHKFDEPNEFRLDRENARKHLTFGHGAHLCAGASLARAEGRIGVAAILERLADIRISEQMHGPPGARRFTYLPTYQLRGLESLHLEYTPAE